MALASRTQVRNGLPAAIFAAGLARGVRFADESHLPFGGRAGSASGHRPRRLPPCDGVAYELQTVVLGG